MLGLSFVLMNANKNLAIDHGASGPALGLSASTIADTAAIGDVIGNLAVSGGTGTYTYSFQSNPGTLFSITSSSLKVAAALTAGSYAITIRADNGAGSVIDQPFLITVTSSATLPEGSFYQLIFG